MIETWIDYDEDYKLSNTGKWFSKKSNKEMKQNINSSGYYRAELCHNGKRKHVFTHIKVVQLFGDKFGNKLPCEPSSKLRDYGISIDHIDKNKSHNSQDNLEIVTHIENCRRRDNRNEEELF